MSRRNKLQKFAEVSALGNVFENFDVTNDLLLCEGKECEMAGRWHEHFGNSYPITLELACGKGEYTIGLAQMFPQRNFIGVDIKGARIWKGARKAIDLNLRNAAFLRTRIELIERFFAAGEIAEIWIVFPDPFPRESKANRRLTSPPFLEIYKRLIAMGGLMHLKTDDAPLHAYTLGVVQADPTLTVLYHNDDIYATPVQYDELEIKTYYEGKHLADGRRITYIRFRRGG